FLGDMIDIHGGGLDLVFPHHENEIVQSCCANGTKIFAQFWIHNGYININGEKMAKSLKNFLSLRAALSQYDGETIRYALLSTHYRKPINWSEQKLKEAYNSLKKMYRCLMDSSIDPTHLQQDTPLDPKVQEALCNDLNTPQALGRLHELLNAKQLDAMVVAAQQMGLLYNKPDQWFAQHATSEQTLDDDTVEQLIIERNLARSESNYQRADEIRDQLSVAGIALKDEDKKTQWYRK
ncbi:MAG: DALR domain-containing protein, partial [Candidatus Oxydemutatoraceae bacterium WSBS_2016_MAG_OTU14]